MDTSRRTVAVGSGARLPLLSSKRVGIRWLQADRSCKGAEDGRHGRRSNRTGAGAKRRRMRRVLSKRGCAQLDHRFSLGVALRSPALTRVVRTLSSLLLQMHSGYRRRGRCHGGGERTNERTDRQTDGRPDWGEEWMVRQLSNLHRRKLTDEYNPSRRPSGMCGDECVMIAYAATRDALATGGSSCREAEEGVLASILTSSPMSVFSSIYWPKKQRACSSVLLSLLACLTVDSAAPLIGCASSAASSAGRITLAARRTLKSRVCCL
ncbi:hypothetical protein K431DRAFT_24826 [Polychaeton citri CBS 116435]|uniref:Uncharacterized protein n=1 Tax=Polychaeton citri CBS 116435 TaxID=1314669 RepID=A0A9P4PYA0_9PEZI|nr:hypothetical protein K431DRAFT_24826 [Polychaeton citri CBS 116435]